MFDKLLRLDAVTLIVLGVIVMVSGAMIARDILAAVAEWWRDRDRRREADRLLRRATDDALTRNARRALRERETTARHFTEDRP